MGLPKPFGPYNVAFADFELRRTTEIRSGGNLNRSPSSSREHQKNRPDFVGLADAHGAPLMRLFYPTSHQTGKVSNTDFSLFFQKSRRWIPSLMYTWGYVSKLIPPSSALQRFVISILAGTIHSVMCLGVFIQASVGGPLLPVCDKDGERRLPVVIFSHGLWACRTTYTAFCCDLASHGYIVVSVEHLDGSANMASYMDHNGKRNWLQNTHAAIPINKIKLQDRAKQLRKRVLEVRKVIDVLESLDQGLLTQNANAISGKAGLIVDMLHARLDLCHVAVSGHSFGGATAIAASGIDERIKCCLAMDVWWEPINKVEFEKLAGKVPVLLLNTENFDWNALRDARIMFMKARAESKQNGRTLITELKTIKGSSHQDQSDFSIVFPRIMQNIGAAGELDPLITRNVNNKACLEFLHKHLLPPGTQFPYAVDLGEDAKYLIVDAELAS